MRGHGGLFPCVELVPGLSLSLLRNQMSLWQSWEDLASNALKSSTPEVFQNEVNV